jgi:membrane associated rhomboid family serine protease
MLIPFRAKNPPERFPWVTVVLIAVNALIFALTSDHLIVVQKSAVVAYAVSHETLSLTRLLTSMFLHGSILHLGGNMLFLWIFGASLEGRLGPAKYLGLYLVAGLAGGLLHDLAAGSLAPAQYSLGASGAIMGLAGAYVYVFPYSHICLFWLFYFRGGVTEWQARWVVLLYVGMDVFFAFLLPHGDGVAHFAHLGGFGAGLLGVLLLRPRRDSVDFSEAQAVRAEMQDYSLLSLNEMEVLMQQPREDLQLIMAYCDKSLRGYNGHTDRCLAALNRHIKTLVEGADPVWLAQTLLAIPHHFGSVPPIFFLRLGSRLEAMAAYDLAVSLYRRLHELSPTAPETEMALFRTAQLMRTVYHNREYAWRTYNEMLRLFPHGPMSLDAQRALQQMST